MGPTISADQIQASEEKIKAVKLKQINLQKELEEKQFVKGNTVGKDSNFSSITQNDNEASIYGNLSKMIEAMAGGGSEVVFQSIAKQILAFAEATRTTNVVIQQFKSFPFVTKVGFVMINFHFYMEKIKIVRNSAVYEQTLVMSVYKTVAPKPPKSKYELGQSVEASALTSEADRVAVTKSIWNLILMSLSP